VDVINRGLMMVGVRRSVIFLHNERMSILFLTVLLERKELRLQKMLAVPKPIDTAFAFSPRQFTCFGGEFPCRSTNTYIQYKRRDQRIKKSTLWSDNEKFGA
jgi:hypothetical protein